MFFFFKQKTAYEVRISDGVQTCALPIYGGAAKVLDVYIDEDERPGTWALGEGQVHHAAFEVADLDVQAALKFDVEGLGYTDFSDRKHRGYFESIYVRTPGGVLFEASVTLGFTHDESPEKLGSE